MGSPRGERAPRIQTLSDRSGIVLLGSDVEQNLASLLLQATCRPCHSNLVQPLHRMGYSVPNGNGAGILHCSRLRLPVSIRALPLRRTGQLTWRTQDHSVLFGNHLQRTPIPVSMKANWCSRSVLSRYSSTSSYFSYLFRSSGDCSYRRSSDLLFLLCSAPGSLYALQVSFTLTMLTKRSWNLTMKLGLGESNSLRSRENTSVVWLAILDGLYGSVPLSK